VTLYFLDDVFLLHLAFKTPQSVLKGFTLLQSNFRQTNTPPNPPGRTRIVIAGIQPEVKGRSVKKLAGMLGETITRIPFSKSRTKVLANPSDDENSGALFAPSAS
jgi:hypothetical protein